MVRHNRKSSKSIRDSTSSDSSASATSSSSSSSSSANNSKKTKKRRHKFMSSESLPGRCCDATMHGIFKWYDETFEKLGWMILANSRGMTDKIKTYMNSLARLKMAVEKKIENIHDSDKKDDLIIMLDNINILNKHVVDDFSH